MIVAGWIFLQVRQFLEELTAESCLLTALPTAVQNVLL
jgi:hypothetical protein